MTFNTGNPIGSTDARDLSDNAENFDKSLNDTSLIWVDRLGVTRDSFEGRLAKGSFYRVGTFAAGYTLTNMRQTLEYSGHEYSWAGTFPKVVAAGATPATSGGIGAGAWVDRTSNTLKDDLLLDGGDLVSVSVSELSAEVRLISDKACDEISVLDFYSSTDINHQLAFEKAAATGRHVLIPSGKNYTLTSNVVGMFYSYGPVSITGGSVSFISDLQDSTPDKLTQIYSRHQAFAPLHTYTAWPYGCLFTETISGIEYLLQVYTGGSTHVATDRRIYLRKMNLGDGDASVFGLPIDIVALSGYVPAGGVVTHAAGKCANGDYIVIAGDRNSAQSTLTHLIFRSTDKGATWTYTTGAWRGGSGFLVTKTGRVISGYGQDAGTLYIDTSDDNGATWTRRSVGFPVGTNPIEPSFVQVGSGEIISVWRRDIDGVFTDKRAYIYSISSDNGSTWSTLTDTNFVDANNSPCALVYHTEEDVVEMFSCSRYAMNDGYASLYQSYATDILTGKFSEPIRLGIGANSQDFGYPSACVLRDKKVAVTIYNGTGAGGTSIQLLRGTRSTGKNNTPLRSLISKLINPYTGKAHADFTVKNEGIKLLNVNEITHTGQAASSVINLRGDKNYFGSSIQLFSSTSLAQAINTVDVFTPINAVGKWNGNTKGLWIYVEWKVNSTGTYVMQFGNSEFSETIKETDSVGGLTRSRILLVPIDTVASSLRCAFNAPSGGTIAAYQIALVNAIGYSL